MRVRRSIVILVPLMAALLVFWGCSVDVNLPEPPIDEVPVDEPLPDESSVTPDISDEELNDILVAIGPQVSEIRGLNAPAGVGHNLISRADIEERFGGGEDDPYLITEGELYKLLGTFGSDVDFPALLGRLQGNSIGAFFSGREGIINVQHDSGSGLLFSTLQLYAHEYVHYLQSVQGLEQGSSWFERFFEGGLLSPDELNAVDALLEGDARFTENLYREVYRDSFPLLEDWEADPELMALRDHLLVQTTLFPYEQGSEFVGAIYEKGGFDAVNALYDEVPISSEQVLHPELYPDETPIELPARLTQPPNGWQLSDDPTFSGAYGEFFIRAWLETIGTTNATASSAAAGWGNDNLYLLNSFDSGEYGLQWVIAWDDPTTDTVQFAGALSEAIKSNPDLNDGSCGDATDISWSADTGVLVHQIQDDPTVGAVTRIAIAPSCEAALELLSEGNG